MHLLLHTITHSFIDTIKIIPFIFLMYLLIEYIEHKNNTDLSHMLMKSKKSGPFYGGILGCIPQCGFSVIASDLFAKSSISLGALIAIYIATSDEAIPIFLSYPGMGKIVFKIVFIKILFAVLFGFIIDIIFNRKNNYSICKKEEHHEHFHGNCENCESGMFKASLIHTFKIFVFLFIASFLLSLIIELIGQEVLSRLLLKKSVVQPFIASVIGLIPSCASSVILCQAYIKGIITFGSLIGGLCSSAGVGILVLFKRNKNLKENIKILSILFILGGIAGIITNLIFPC